MLAQVFNPTEIKKNGPATRPASAPARRRASPFTAVSAVLPTTGPKLRRCPRERQRMIVGRGWWLGAALPQHGPESGLNWTASRAQDHRARQSTARPRARSLIPDYGCSGRPNEHGTLIRQPMQDASW